MIERSYYEILGLTPEATQEEIKQGYRKMASVNHPDRNRGDDSEFKKVEEAYRTLCDPELKSQYDERGFALTDDRLYELAREQVFIFISQGLQTGVINLKPFIIKRAKETLNEVVKERDNIERFIRHVNRHLKGLSHKKNARNSDCVLDYLRAQLKDAKFGLKATISKMEGLKAVEQLMDEYDEEGLITYQPSAMFIPETNLHGGPTMD